MKKRPVITIILLAYSLLPTSLSARGINPEKNINTTTLSEADSVISNLWIRVDSFMLDILPPSSGVSFYRDGILHLSSTRLEGSIPGNHISFGTSDARYSVLDKDKIEDTKIFSSGRSLVLPCEAVSFSSDYNTMYYTKYSKKEGGEKIYKANYNSAGTGSWTFDDQPLAFCSNGSNYNHPALSADGNVLVFASDRPESLGGMDLFVSLLKEGAWSDPVNLGDAVNSTANELYPYLDANNNLYFSSDNPEGYGGYDIYVCKFRKNTWEKPANLKSQVNTEYDDVAFSIDRLDGKTAFYTVKENEGRRSQQLFMVNLNKSVPDTLLTLSQHFTNPDLSSTVILALEPAVEATSARAEEARLRSEEIRSDNDIIKYRVQFGTSFNPGSRTSINVDSKDFDVYEYLYSGAYRLFVGEFNNLSGAVDLQNTLKNNDYPRASVVAFKNNVLSLDPELLTERTIDRPAVEEVLKEEVTAEPEVKKETAIVIPENKEEAKRVTTNTKQAVSKDPEVKQETVNAKPETLNAIVYRIQILSTTKPKGSVKISIAGKQYDSWEYFYVGAYRTTIGAFSTLKEAAAFQKIVRQNGYPEAWVATFIGDERKK